MDGTSDQQGGRGTGRRCPICNQPTRQETRPFCSRRCADVDLGRWLGGAYRVAGRPPDEDDGDLPLAEGQASANRNDRADR